MCQKIMHHSCPFITVFCHPCSHHSMTFMFYEDLSISYPEKAFRWLFVCCSLVCWVEVSQYHKRVVDLGADFMYSCSMGESRCLIYL